MHSISGSAGLAPTQQQQQDRRYVEHGVFCSTCAMLAMTTIQGLVIALHYIVTCHVSDQSLSQAVASCSVWQLGRCGQDRPVQAAHASAYDGAFRRASRIFEMLPCLLSRLRNISLCMDSPAFKPRAALCASKFLNVPASSPLNYDTSVVMKGLIKGEEKRTS